MNSTVHNPFSGELVAELPFDTRTDIDRKLDEARVAQLAWARLDVQERVLHVARGMDYFRERSEEVARDVSLQMGKPITQARAELAGMLERSDHMLAIAADVLEPDIMPAEENLHRRIEHVPLGVVLNLAAWNYPLLIPVNVVVPALLAGNSVLLKHSARTPLCGLHFQRAFANLEPANLVTQLIVGHGATAEIVGDARVDQVAFTGSVDGGHAVQRAASDRFIDVGLELGGKDPAYVAADCDLDATVAGIVDGACYNAGQSCCAIERVYVHASIYDDFLARVQPHVAAYQLGDPLDETTTMGPLASASALAFLEQQVRGAVEGGARLLIGGATRDRIFFEPTLIADCPDASDLMRSESFGPIVACRSVVDDDHGLERMNDSDLGLTASVWTKDRERAEWFGARLQVGTVFQNRCDFLDPALAWTGVKDTGKGVTLSSYGLLQLTRRKSFNFRA